MFSPQEKVSQQVIKLFKKLDDLQIEVSNIRDEIENFETTMNSYTNEFLCLKCGNSVEELHEVLHNYTALLAFLTNRLKYHGDNSRLDQAITMFLNSLDPDILKE